MGKKDSKKKAEEVVEETVVDQVEENQPTEEVTEEETTPEVEDTRTQEEKQLEDLTDKVSELNDKYLRLSAEYDNYRKRTLKERMELTKTAGEGLLKGMLPVVDDFDRALSHLSEASDLDAVKEGIGLIYTKFQEYLKQNGVIEIDWSPVIRGVVKDLQDKKNKAEISLKFHNAVCRMIKDVCELLRKKHRINKICLSGGVFQNRFLVSHVKPILETSGFELYLHDKVPAHDGGIALGQAALAV